MRAAASIAGAVIVAGIYLAIGASIGLTPTWIAIGMLAIALSVSVSLVARSPRAA